MAKDTNKIVMITSNDNPYNPFDNWDEWWSWDTGPNGYHTYEMLNRYLDQITDVDRDMYGEDTDDRDIAIAKFLVDNYKTHKKVERNA